MWKKPKKEKLTVAEILDKNRPDLGSGKGVRAWNQEEASPAFTESVNKILARARAEGTSVEDILAADFGPLNSSAAESKDCLKPVEVMAYTSEGALPDDRIEHIRGCSWCATLVACARPAEQEIENVIAWVQQEAPAGVSTRARVASTAVFSPYEFEPKALQGLLHRLQEKFFRRG